MKLIAVISVMITISGLPLINIISGSNVLQTNPDHALRRHRSAMHRLSLAGFRVSGVLPAQELLVG